MNTLFMILMTPNSTLFPYTTLFRSEVIVNADDDVESARLLDWRGNDDSFDTAFKITLQLLLLQELARAFENDVAAKIAPGHFLRRGRRREADPAPSDGNSILPGNLECGGPATVDAVEFEEMGSRSDAALYLVDMIYVEAVACARIARNTLDAAQRRTQGETPHASHAVDSDAHDAPSDDNLAVI